MFQSKCDAQKKCRFAESCGPFWKLLSAGAYSTKTAQRELSEAAGKQVFVQTDLIFTMFAGCLASWLDLWHGRWLNVKPFAI